ILSDENLQTQTVSFWVNRLRETFNGDILPFSDGSVPPAIFPPFINNQRDFERLNTYEWVEKDNQVMNYLEEIYLYLNGCEEEDDSIWKQIPSYLCSDKEMDSRKLLQWLDGCIDKQISQVYLLGGDVLMYKDLNEIWGMLEQKSMSIQLYYRYDLFTENHKKLLNATIGQLTFVVPMWKFDEELFSSLSRTVEGIEQNKRWLFLITSDNEYELAEQLVSKYSLESRSIRPVYKEDNLSFFKDAVYLEETDICNTCLEKRDFYVSQKINKNDFGRLTVLPDDKIYANVNHAEIGVMEKDTIASVLYKEMTEGHSWLRIRDQKPCCDCIYQWLCPSPSNYELAIGKPNLCHVKP
ncbi:TIGR04150 pseudo-rSAM protein, partial [Bacteroides fragilis]